LASGINLLWGIARASGTLSTATQTVAIGWHFPENDLLAGEGAHARSIKARAGAEPGLTPPGTCDQSLAAGQIPNGSFFDNRAASSLSLFLGSAASTLVHGCRAATSEGGRSSIL